MSQPPDEPPEPTLIEPGEWEALSEVDLEVILSRRVSGRKRMVYTGLIVATLAVLLLTFWELVPRISSGVTAPSQPPPLPGAVAIVSNVNYGSVSINGRTEPSILPTVIKLHGKAPYRITLVAPPFRRLTCPFSPPSPGTSPSGIIGNADSFTPCVVASEYILQHQFVTVLAMLFTLADLPLDQQRQITSLVPRDVTAEQTIAVPAGSTIATGLTSDGVLASASFPGELQATAFLVPSQPGNLEGTGCQGYICADTGIFTLNSSLSGQYLEVTAAPALRWLITRADGHVVSDVTFPPASILTLYFSYTPGAGWQLALVTPAQLHQDLIQMVCATGQSMLVGEARHLASQDSWGVTTLQDRGLEGCLLGLQLNNVDEGHFVWRFGALMAADARAHHTLPQLSMASSPEIAAVS